VELVGDEELGPRLAVGAEHHVKGVDEAEVGLAFDIIGDVVPSLREIMGGPQVGGPEI